MKRRNSRWGNSNNFWHHVHVDFLWVSEEYRHEGYGSKLIKLIEEFAIEKGVG